MANNFTDSFPANLIGLWDFRVGNEPDDTGLDDGFAQNGVFIDGAQALADQLVLDGFVEQQFDVNGNDAPFDLSAGTLITEFTQFGNTGVTFQTVVNRGTYWHGADDGYFEIHVTETGAVEVTHNVGPTIGGTTVFESTGPGFFAPNDTVRATYTWSETDGGAFTVQNLTSGDSFTTDITTTGLTMAIGDTTLQNFTFGARENTDEEFMKFFNGQIDYVALYDAEIVVVPCFTPGTLIATPEGERAVEDLKVGDRVITRDNGIQPIRWVGRRELSVAELAAASHLNPVRIKAGALGHGLPERDMLVSPNHRVLVSNDRTALYFEEREVLVAAKHLVGMEGIDIVDEPSVTYIHFMFDQHEVVLSDGAWTESFQPGDMSLAGVGTAQRDEIYELFPELAGAEGVEAYQSARRALKKHEARLVLN